MRERLQYMFKNLLKKKMNYEKSYDIKKSALEKVLGPVDFVLHSPIPFHLGYDMGGKSDVFVFKKHIHGVVHVTNDLIESDQLESNIGKYELMICHQNEDDKWGANIISNLAFYTLDEKINSGDTTSIENIAGENSKIKAFLFYKYADVTDKIERAKNDK